MSWGIAIGFVLETGFQFFPGKFHGPCRVNHLDVERRPVQRRFTGLGVVGVELAVTEVAPRLVTGRLVRVHTR